MPDNVIQLTDGQLKMVVKDTVTETLTMLGMEADDPLEMQRDFQHLRGSRMAVAAVRKKSIVTLVGIVLAGACATLWMGLKGSLGQ